MTTLKHIDSWKEALAKDIALGYFMKVSTWWGLSDHPGSETLIILKDGSYQLHLDYAQNPPPGIDISDKNGKLDKEVMEKLEAVALLMTNNESFSIYDMGFEVSIIRDGKRIMHNNVRDTYKKITDILGPVWKRS